MQFTRTNINKTFRNGVVNASNVAVTNVGGGSSSLSGNFLPAVNNGDGSYTVDLSKVLFTGSVISEGEVTAYGSSDGSGSTTTGGVTIIDGLDSVATDCALSANQGRILKELIDNTAGGVTALAKLTDVSLSSLTNGQILKYDAVLKKWVNDTLDNTKVTWTNIEGKPADLTDTNIAKWNELAKNNHIHTNKSALDKITEANITNWNDANNKKHTHSNKSVLDGITSAKVTNWDGVATNWNKAFYFDSNGDLKVKVNVIGEKEVSAYGAGASGGSGSITIVDALTSTATDAALSANQGRILRELIDNVGGGVSSWNDLTDKPNWITDTKPSYSWSEIGSKPSTFTPSTHTHNYASTVKVGSTSYNVSGNTISLPAYPTVPSALKNPNALTISLNGTSQGAYDGSAAKSINITAASVGAAASSHSHNYLPLSGGTLTGNVTFSTDSTLAWNRNTDNFSIGFKNTGDSDADSYGWMKMADNGNEYFKWLQVSGSTTTELMSLKSDGLRFKGTKVSLEGHTHSQYLTSYTNNYLTGVSGSGNGTVTFTRNGLGNLTWNASHSHSYAGSSSAGGAATSANKVNSTLTFTGYQSKSFNGSAAVSVAIPNNTNQLTNGAGFITSSASISGNAGSATKLQTARTIWGQSFNGTGNVSGSMTGVGAISMSGNLTMAHSSTPTLTLKNNNNADVQIILDRNANASWKILNQSGTLYFQNNWVNGGKGSYFTALSIAYQTGHIVSKGNITSNGEITAYSDIRLKTDIQPLENRGYIKPVTYKKDGKDSIGFIAQEVRELYPELVIEDNTEDKYLSVNYAQYVAVLQAQIIELNNRVKQLEKWHYQVQE